MLPELLNIKHLFVLEAWPPLSLGLPHCALLCMHVWDCLRESLIWVHMYVGYSIHQYSNTYTYVCMYINIGVHAYMYIHVLQENLPAINQRPVNMEELICGGGGAWEEGCFRCSGTCFCDSLHCCPVTLCYQLFNIYFWLSFTMSISRTNTSFPKRREPQRISKLMDW